MPLLRDSWRESKFPSRGFGCWGSVACSGCCLGFVCFWGLRFLWFYFGLGFVVAVLFSFGLRGFLGFRISVILFSGGFGVYSPCSLRRSLMGEPRLHDGSTKPRALL